MAPLAKTLASVLELMSLFTAAFCDSQVALGRDSTSSVIGAKKPNIVLILTDDQDLHMSSLDYMPLTQKHLIDQGTLYRRHFCTTAICCPARATLLTGKAAHNTNVTDVFPPFGGYPKFVSQGHNDAYLPVFLQDAGYNTYYTGKLFNAHSVDNYDGPYPKGWTGSDFLLDPYTYTYLNATFQRNKEAPVSHEGEYSTDVLAGKALGFLNNALDSDKPFFLGIAPIAPHSNVPADVFDPQDPSGNDGLPNFLGTTTPPIPAERHAHLFPDAIVPRSDNFNPDSPSGVNWVRKQPKLTDDNVASNDHFYRHRLRALQAVDEMVELVVHRLEEAGVLDETYLFYTSDNGYHIGHHRLQPGKECGFEEDINVPLIVRGPGVPRGQIAGVVTTHTDLVPTFLQLAGAPIRADFDGVAIPLTDEELGDAAKTRHEHVTVEYWGLAASEGKFGWFGGNDTFVVLNNTYKGLRVVSEEYNLYYSVWCTNEHELYDLNTDPGQLNNLLDPSSKATTLLSFPIGKIISRLDSLLFVTKSCKGSVCAQPWRSLHPQGNVESLRDALSPRFDSFYEEQVRVEYNRCELGYIVESEGPQFEKDGLVYWRGRRWSHWV